MIFALDNGEMTTDLDCQQFDILNVGELLPIPVNLVATDDPRLSDARAPLDGSVTDISVADNAAIVQSKLNLNGQIPLNWLGTTATTAARGDLAEYVTNKAVPNGYASLDATGHVPPSQLPTGTGSGTVTSVALAMPAAEFDVTGSPVTTFGTITVAWDSQVAGSWFGNALGVSAVPMFNTAVFPVSLIPGLPATKITTGLVDPARLPIAVGIGVSHAPGAVPDPGATGNASDYLARDMTYQPVPTTGLSYQPTVPDPAFSASSGPPYLVTISDSLTGTSLFYSVGGGGAGGYQPYTGVVTVQAGQTLYAYGARAGYTNSQVVSYSAPSPPPLENVTTGAPGNPNEIVYVTVELGDPVTVG